VYRLAITRYKFQREVPPAGLAGVGRNAPTRHAIPGRHTDGRGNRLPAPDRKWGRSKCRPSPPLLHRTSRGVETAFGPTVPGTLTGREQGEHENGMMKRIGSILPGQGGIQKPGRVRKPLPRNAPASVYPWCSDRGRCKTALAAPLRCRVGQPRITERTQRFDDRQASLPLNLWPLCVSVY